MFYKLFQQKGEHHDWGGVTYLYETDKTGMPIKKLTVYENGKIFGYDTENRSDAAGHLEEKPLYDDKKSRREWAKYRIGKQEFEKAWQQPESVPADAYQDTLDKVHVAGNWTIALGLMNVAIGLVLGSVINHKDNVDPTAKHWVLAYCLVLGVIVGLGLMSLGILLRRTTKQTLARVLKLITIVLLFIIIVPLLNLIVSGSGSIGILGLIVLFQVLKAQKKTVQLGYATSLGYRLTALAVALLITLPISLVLHHFNSQLASKTASSSTAPKPKQPKHFTSTQAAASLAAATSISQAQQALQTFASQYNLQLQVAHASGSIPSASSSYSSVTNNDLSALKSYGSLWIDEWAKYPTDWVQHSKLQIVVFVKSLTTGGQVGTSSADPAHQTLYYNIDTPSDVAHADIHATFFTLITYNDFGSYTPTDTTWSSYNTAGFTYGSHDEYCQNPDHSSTCDHEHPWRGFVDYQATTSLQADKSELYVYLMTDDHYSDLKSWLANDTILHNKANYLYAYMHRYSPEITSNYFDDINP